MLGVGRVSKKRKQRFEWAEISLATQARNRELTRLDIHMAALRFQLHPAQERRLVAKFVGKEEVGGANGTALPQSE